MDPVPPPHRPAPRCATATPPRTGRPPPPRPAVPAQKQTGLAEKGRGFRARCRPPRRRSPCRGRSSTLVAASGETATVGAAPHARRPPPAPSLRLRCQRRGPPARRTNDTPAAASVPKDHLDAPSVRDRGWTTGRADPDLAAGRAPPLRPPARRTSPGRADSGDPRPAPGQRPARPPARRTDAPPCSLQTEGANAQTPIRLRLAASLSVQGRAASSMKTSLSPEARTALSLRTEFRATTSDRRNPTAQFPPA